MEPIEQLADQKAKDYVKDFLHMYNNRYQEAGYKDFKAGFISGHQSRDAEVDRMKGLIEEAFKKAYRLSRESADIDGGYYDEMTWLAFKSDNNL